MPKRTDIKSIMIIGAGPIIIGQACEFDYSGTQACKALKEEGYRIILVNSNPATIMTDPELADATYIEPITPEVVAKIVERASRRAAADHGRPDRAQHVRAWRMLDVLEKFGVEIKFPIIADLNMKAKTASSSATRWTASASKARAPGSSTTWKRRWRRSRPPACPRSSAPPTRWAAPAAASPTTNRNSPTSSKAASMPAP